MTNTYLNEYYQNPERMRQLQQECLITEVTQLMYKAMRERKINRAQLADALNLTKGRISQILNGRANLTLRTTADIFTALKKTLTPIVRDLFILEPGLQCDLPESTPVPWKRDQGDSWSLPLQEYELPQLGTSETAESLSA